MSYRIFLPEIVAIVKNPFEVKPVMIWWVTNDLEDNSNHVPKYKVQNTKSNAICLALAIPALSF